MPDGNTWVKLVRIQSSPPNLFMGEAFAKKPNVADLHSRKILTKPCRRFQTKISRANDSEPVCTQSS